MKTSSILRTIILLSVGTTDSAQASGEKTELVTIIAESFEGELPSFHTFQAKYESTSSQTHTGSKSLLVSPESGKTGGAYFRLGDKLLPGKTYEFSAAVQITEGGRASLYLSAVVDGGRKTLATASGPLTIGKWAILRGMLRSDTLSGRESDQMLAMVTNGAAYYDDIRLQEIVTIEPPIISWPKTLTKLKENAAGKAQTLVVGKNLSLRSQHGALAPNLGHDTITPTSGPTEIPADGALVFAIDLPKAAILTGALQLRHTADLQPGLRAYVLIDSILTAAPMVSAAPWSNPGRVINRPVPSIAGNRPSESIALTSCRLRAGRHYVILAGPHTRSAGEFLELILQAAPIKDWPLYSFALFSDTHLGEGRSEWMNIKLTGPVVDQLKQAFEELHSEAVDFAFIAGDMTDTGTAAQYAALGKVANGAGFPVYGIMGNHETFQPSSRADLAKHAAHLFPGGDTYYALKKPPLRFLILDKSYWRNKEGAILDYPAAGYSANTLTPPQVTWMEKQLAADQSTPTIVLSHFPFFAEPRPSSSGYELVSWVIHDTTTELIRKAPNVIATLNGHTHWNQTGQSGRIRWIQNAAFVEWPSTYRLFRVYPSHVEWETRIAPNLGFLRESIIPEKNLTWMISTQSGDLAGQIKLP